MTDDAELTATEMIQRIGDAISEMRDQTGRLPTAIYLSRGHWMRLAASMDLVEDKSDKGLKSDEVGRLFGIPVKLHHALDEQWTS